MGGMTCCDHSGQGSNQGESLEHDISVSLLPWSAVKPLNVKTAPYTFINSLNILPGRIIFFSGRNEKVFNLQATFLEEADVQNQEN